MLSAPNAHWMVAATAEDSATTQDRRRELADFDALVKLYWPRVFRFMLGSVRDRDAAQTLAQDCFFKAYQAREGFRGEASLITWLLRIAVNLIRDYGRSRKLQFWRTAGSDSALKWTPDEAVDAERRVLLKEQVETMRRVVASLPERQRTVFLLRYVEEMELLEIVAVTGLKANAVKVHLYRAVRKVRASVGRLR